MRPSSPLRLLAASTLGLVALLGVACDTIELPAGVAGQNIAPQAEATKAPAPSAVDGQEPQRARENPLYDESGGKGVNPLFEVQIAGADVDSAWETMSGGSLNIEIADASVGTDQFHTTTPGHKYVDTLTLRGPLTSGRTAADGSSSAAARGVNEGSYEVLENGAGKFKVDIEGAPVASANVHSVTTEDLVIDVREMTTGADWDYRVYGPGDAHYGSVTIRSRVGKDSKELYQWWLDTSQGKNIRKSVSVVALKRDGAEARRYSYLDCFPTRYEPLVVDEASGGLLEGVVLTCSRIEVSDADGARKALLQWITDTVQGKDWKRTVTVKEITKDGGAGKTFTYLDCFPTRYVFPAFSASSTGNLYEEVSIKPIRLELS